MQGANSISIVLPAFNGKALLERYLPSVLEACQSYTSGNVEIIIVDDASSDETSAYLESNFPFIKLIKQRVNKGFSVCANLGVFSASSNIVVLLNTDIEIAKDFLLFLPEYFQDETVFAVRPGLYDNLEDKTSGLKNPRVGGAFRFGLFDVPRAISGEPKLCFFAGGGAAAFDRAKFMQLGGFDTLFSPFYYEDVDLSYRALKRGWKIAYEPRSLAYHQGGGTINQFYARWRIKAIAERNKYLLVWKNITDYKFIFQHIILTPVRLILSLLKFRFCIILGFFWSFSYLGEVIKRRKQQSLVAKLKDRQIFNLFSQC